MRKKLLAMLLALIMVVSIVPLAASAEETDEAVCSESPDGLHHWAEAQDGYDIPYDDTYCYHLACLYCGEPNALHEHQFVTAADGTTYCQLCCYGCDHSNVGYSVLTTDTHLVYCQTCNHFLGIVSHEFVDGVCVCDAVECAHEHITYSPVSQNMLGYSTEHSMCCENCQLVFSNLEAHTYDENGICTLCGYDSNSIAACSHVDDDKDGACDNCRITYHVDSDGDCVCDLCGQEYHAETVYASTQYGHYVVCTKCGTTIVTAIYSGNTHSDSDEDGICDVCGYIMNPDAGEVSAATGGNVSSSISMNPDAILSDDDKALIDQGYDVQITLSVDEITSTVSSTDSALILSAAGDNVIGVSYLDIDLTKIISDPYGAIQDETALTDLSTAVTITVAIPQALLDAVGTTSGSYSVVRIHDGAATVLATTYDSTAQTVTFTTDRFSTYGIVFTGSTSTNNTNTGLDDVPQTGDSSLILVGIALLMAAVPVVKKFVF